MCVLSITISAIFPEAFSHCYQDTQVYDRLATSLQAAVGTVPLDTTIATARWLSHSDTNAAVRDALDAVAVCALQNFDEVCAWANFAIVPDFIDNLNTQWLFPISLKTGSFRFIIFCACGHA